MKKLILLIVITLTVTFTTSAQQKHNIDNLTAGKWNIEFVEIENEVIDVKNEGNWMVFYTDGLYQILLDDEQQIGTWNLDEQLGIKFNGESSNEKSVIKEIDGSKLKFSIAGYTIALTKEVI